MYSWKRKLSEFIQILKVNFHVQWRIQIGVKPGQKSDFGFPGLKSTSKFVIQSIFYESLNRFKICRFMIVQAKENNYRCSLFFQIRINWITKSKKFVSVQAKQNLDCTMLLNSSSDINFTFCNFCIHLIAFCENGDVNQIFRIN